jgi:hypothetical protein
MTAFKSGLNSHSAFDEEKRFEPEIGAVAENADEDGNGDLKYHEQPARGSPRVFDLFVVPGFLQGCFSHFFSPPSN